MKKASTALTVLALVVTKQPSGWPGTSHTQHAKNRTPAALLQGFPAKRKTGDGLGYPLHPLAVWPGGVRNRALPFPADIAILTSTTERAGATAPALWPSLRHLDAERLIGVQK
jgi:hypothetical protein